MEGLTKKQDAVRRFIVSELRAGRPCPTHREIASHFGFASSYAAACHVKALITKGILVAERGKARALHLAEVFPGVRRPAHCRNSVVRFHPCRICRGQKSGTGWLRRRRYFLHRV